MKPAYRWLVSLFAVMFMALQTSAIAHAASFDDAPHEHNGMVCDIGAIASDAQALLSDIPPAQPLETPHTQAFTSAYVSAPCVTPPGRAPPPRSPPTLF